MIRIKSLRRFALLAVAAGFLYALTAVYVFQVEFQHRVISEIEQEAIRLTGPFTESLLLEAPSLFHGSVQAWAEVNGPSLSRDVRTGKVRIVDGEGRIVYSTVSREIGTVHGESYFREIVKRGRLYSRRIKAGTRLSRDEATRGEVIQSCIPVMEEGSFVGAFEIYSDIEGRKALWSWAKWYGSAIPLSVTLMFLCGILILLYRLDRMHLTNEQAEDRGNIFYDRYQKLVENLRSEYFVYTLDAFGELTHVSSGVRDLLGYDPRELTGAGLRPYLTENPANEEASRLTAHALEGTTIRPFELEIFHKDGTVHILEIVEIPILGENGECRFVEGIAHDVTENRRISAELREQQFLLAEKHGTLSRLLGQVESAKREWERTMDCLEDMILLTDEFGIIRRCNRAVVTFSGRLYDEVVGSDWREFMKREGLDPGIPNSNGVEVRHEVSGRWYSVRGFPYRRQVDGDIEGLVLLFQDISQLKHTREELERTAAEISESRAKIAGILGEISSISDWVGRELTTEDSASGNRT